MLTDGWTLLPFKLPKQSMYKAVKLQSECNSLNEYFCMCVHVLKRERRVFKFEMVLHFLSRLTSHK